MVDEPALTLFGGSDATAPEPLPVLHPDWKAAKQYYSIGEVAELFGMRTSAIRFWTNEFRLKVRTTAKGDRLYTAERIRDLRTIYRLIKEEGYTLAGAKVALKDAGKPQPPPAAPALPATALHQQLLSLRNRLVALRNQL